MTTVFDTQGVLEAAPPPAYGDGKLWDAWKMYPFNYVSSPDLPPWGQVNQLHDFQLGFSLDGHFISYLIQDDPQYWASEGVINYDEPVFILALSTTNSAHSISELLSFIDFYNRIGCSLRIGVNSFIVEKLPFLYQLLQTFISQDKILLLDSLNKHAFKRAWIRLNVHLNFVNAFQDIPYTEDGKVLRFENLQPMAKMFLEDPSAVMAKAAELHAKWSATHDLPEKVMLLKTSEDKVVTTPGRAMEISPALKQRFIDSGIAVVSIGDFSCIEEYVATLYGAKVFITSYGGPACTNRFFCNPNARVILLANLHYQWEYEYPSAGGAYWHIRHSHLFPVAEQLVLLDHNNEMAEADYHRILELAK